MGRTSDRRATDLEGSRSLDGTRDGGPEGADDSGAEHDGRKMKLKREAKKGLCKKKRWSGGEIEEEKVVMEWGKIGGNEAMNDERVWILLRLGGSKILAAGQSRGGRKP